MLPMKNVWFAVLPATVREAWRPALTMMEFKKGDRLLLNEDNESVYFPINCVATMTGKPANGTASFLRFSSANFVIGLADFLNGSDIQYEAIFCGAGYAFALPSSMIRAALPSVSELGQLQVSAVSRIAEKVLLNGHCVGSHNGSQRLARILLEAIDSFGEGRPVTLTQQELSDLLMLRRETVSQMLNEWMSDDLVTLKRATIAINHRALLEDKTCHCYRTIKEFERSELDFWRSIPWAVPADDK